MIPGPQASGTPRPACAHCALTPVRTFIAFSSSLRVPPALPGSARLASPRALPLPFPFLLPFHISSQRPPARLHTSRVRLSAWPRNSHWPPPQLPCRVDSNACARDLAVLPGLGYLLTYHIAQDSCHSPANPDSVPAREGVVVPAPMAALTPAAAERAAAQLGTRHLVRVLCNRQEPEGAAARCGRQACAPEPICKESDTAWGGRERGSRWCAGRVGNALFVVGGRGSGGGGGDLAGARVRHGDGDQGAD